MTDLRQAAQAVLERWDAPLWKTGTTAAAIADLRKALEQPEQVVDCPRCGHVCSQREWIGLTDEEAAIASAEFDTKLKLAFHAGMYKAQIILRKKNDSTY
jgi:hypothetical protein